MYQTDRSVCKARGWEPSRMRAWTAFVTVAAAAAQSPPRPPCGSNCSQGFALIRPAGRTWPVFAARGSICSQGFGVIRPAGELLDPRGSCSTRGELLERRGELFDPRGSCSNCAEVATPARIPGPPARADPQNAAPNAPEWPPTRQSAGADPESGARPAQVSSTSVDRGSPKRPPPGR